MTILGMQLICTKEFVGLAGSHKTNLYYIICFYGNLRSPIAPLKYIFFCVFFFELNGSLASSRYNPYMEAGWHRATNTGYAIVMAISSLFCFQHRSGASAKWKTQALLQVGVIIHVPCLGQVLGACPATVSSVISLFQLFGSLQRVAAVIA